VDNDVVAAMIPYFSTYYTNPSNSNAVEGLEISSQIEEARNQIATCFGADSQEIYFTSGATESINTIIKGIYLKYSTKGNKFITTLAEHSSVLQTFEYLKKNGAEVIYLPINSDGLIDINTLESAIDDRTIAVCIMMANNETGVIQDIQRIAEIVHSKNSIFFSDTTQAVGKRTMNFRNLGIDAACISAHKFHGPKGIGAMYLSRKLPRVSIVPLIHGGSQERSLRAGTMNVPGIMGMAKALQIATSQIGSYDRHLIQIRTFLEEKLTDEFDAQIMGTNSPRLSNTLNVMLPDINNLQLLSAIKTKFTLSLGSACTANLNKSSHVIRAMGFSESFAKHTFRISLSKYNTIDEAKLFIETLKTIL